MIRNLNQLVELVAILWCLAALYGRKFRFDIGTIIYVVLNLAIFMLINVYELPTYFFIIIYLGMFFYSLFYYKKNIKVTLVNCFLMAVIISLLQLIVYLPVYYLWMLPYGITQNHELPINIVCLFLIMWIGKKFKLKNLSEFILRKHWLIVSISIFILICLGNGLYNMKEYMYLLKRDYIQIICFVFLFILVIREWQKAQIDAERKKTQLEMNELYYSAYEELLTLIRERQHDMKNHISAIYGMIYTIENYEELVKKQKEYCQYMLDKSEETKILLSAGNPLLAGFLYKKIQEAEKRKIEVEYRISVEKLRDDISEYELVEIIGILVDNAVEELEKIYGDMKKIRIDICSKENNISIVVANSSKSFSQNKIEEFFKSNYSTKEKGRGIGLSKLKKIVQSKSGEIIVSNETYKDINYLQFSVKF